MMHFLKYFFIAVLPLLIIFSQKAHANQLPQELIKDSAYVNSVIDKVEHFKTLNIDSALFYAQGLYEAKDQLTLLPKLKILHLLYVIYENKNIEKAMVFAEEGLGLAAENNLSFYSCQFERNLGVLYQNKGSFKIAINHYFASLAIAKENKYAQLEIGTMISLANLYSINNQFDKAQELYNKAIIYYDSIGEKNKVPLLLNNIGVNYLDQYDDETALTYFNLAIEKAEKVGENRILGTAYNNIGIIHADAGKLELAMTNFRKSFDIYQSMGEKSYLANVYSDIGMLALKMNDNKAAIKNCSRALVINKKRSFILGQERDYNCLYKAYSQMNDHANALKYHLLGSKLRDSLFSKEKLNAVVEAGLKFEHEKEKLRDSLFFEKSKIESELALERERTTGKIFTWLSVFGLLASVIFLWQYLITRKERKKSDSLLLNILPEKTAQQLKNHGFTKASRYDGAAVLFADIVKFTSISEKLSPEELVAMLHEVFGAFDEIVEKHGLEKIKTIGDAYLAVSGIPDDNTSSVVQVVRAALEMQAFMEQYIPPAGNILSRLKMRIGIHAGPVVAGVVGKKKFQYDIWGDTVNVASRMETNSEPGRVNISQTAYEMINDKSGFTFEDRGEISAKNKGKLQMYFVDQHDAIPV